MFHRNIVAVSFFLLKQTTVAAIIGYIKKLYVHIIRPNHLHYTRSTLKRNTSVIIFLSQIIFMYCLIQNRKRMLMHDSQLK